ncbi:hypothetical protein B484DRAFT_409941, partial [Ochromonadaceae sp. CCMP2298]
VTLQHPDGRRTFVLKGGPVLHEYLFRNRCSTTGAFKGILNMRLTFLTQKVVRKGGAPDPLYYGNRSPREARYIQDMMLWLYFNAKLGALDYLYTRYQLAPKAGAKTDKRLLQPRDITAVVKASAEAFGLDPKRFTTSSARRFLAAGGGLEDPEMKQRAGWTPNSTTPATHYLREFEGRGAFAVDSDSLTMEKLQRRLTKPLSVCPTFEVLDDEPKEGGGFQEEGVDSVGPGEGEDVGADDHLVGLLAEVCGAESPPRRDVPMGALAAMASSLTADEAPTKKGRKGRNETV